MFTVELYSDSFEPVRHGIELRPLRYRSVAVGGPESCEIEGICSADDALDALNWLRYWVTVRNPQGDPVWWGYVESVNVTQGLTAIGRSIEELANKVAVLYSYKDPDGNTNQGLTDWAEDAWSQARYGLHELKSPATDLIPSAADIRRDLVLGARSAPPAVAEGAAQAPVTLICRGLWTLYRNQYYAQSNGYGGHDVDATTEIAVGWQLADDTIGFHQDGIYDIERRIHTLLSLIHI